MISPQLQNLKVSQNPQVVRNEVSASRISPKPDVSKTGAHDGSAPFSMQDLVGPVPNRAASDQIQAYLDHHSQRNPSAIKSKINDFIDGFPAMLYAAARNDCGIIQLFVKYGHNVNATYGIPPIPL